ncbi:hypothetical protein Esti_005961 [Eimeria stiedai]
MLNSLFECMYLNKNCTGVLDAVSPPYHDSSSIVTRRVLERRASLPHDHRDRAPLSCAQRELSQLRLSKEKLMEIRDAFNDELVKGLAMHKKHGLKWVPEESSFRMLDSCVQSIPNGNETGVFYALDFGGTNVRAVRCELLGGGKIQSNQFIKNLASCGGKEVDLMARGTTSTQLFDVLVDCVAELVKEHHETEAFKKNPTKLGFTFSFPCVQDALNASVLVAWTKGFATGYGTEEPVVGQDVVQLLSKAIARRGVGVECAAVVNDTVGTLLSCAYQKERDSPPCLVGVILGTGSNCCYVEPEAAQFGYTGSIINVECGNFNKHLPTTPVDIMIDEKSPNPGSQLFEKMISGFYLGELVRLLTLQIFGDAAPAKAKQDFSLDTKDLAVLAAAAIPGPKADDATNANCKAVIKEVWDWRVDNETLKILQDLAFAVFNRSAALAATSIAALAERTKVLEKNGGMTVAVDGSLYVKNSWYGELIRQHLRTVLGDRASNVYLTAADDGSGKGAAVCVAALYQ